MFNNKTLKEKPVYHNFKRCFISAYSKIPNDKSKYLSTADVYTHTKPKK